MFPRLLILILVEDLTCSEMNVFPDGWHRESVQDLAFRLLSSSTGAEWSPNNISGQVFLLRKPPRNAEIAC
jgi:hypothetical protein